MMTKSAILAAWLAAFAAPFQGPPAIDTSKIGPAVGAAVPAFSGTDQFGRQHTLTSASGPRGLMLVFYRSASW